MSARRPAFADKTRVPRSASPKSRSRSPTDQGRSSHRGEYASIDNPTQYHRRPSTIVSASLFKGKCFCLAFPSSAQMSDLVDTIRAYGGQVELNASTEKTTHLLVSHSTDMTSIIHNLQSSENALISELIENALVRGLPVLIDSYIWQCIFTKQMLEPSGFEVVRLDENGQYVIPKDRPNIRRAASEPAAAEMEVDRPLKRRTRPDIRTAARPSMKRFNTYHPSSVAASANQDDGEDIVLSRRPSGVHDTTNTAEPGAKPAHGQSPSAKSDAPMTSSPVLQRPSLHEQSSSGTVYVYASPRPNKVLKFPTGLSTVAPAKKVSSLSGSDSSSNETTNVDQMPRPALKKSQVLEMAKGFGLEPKESFRGESLSSEEDQAALEEADAAPPSTPTKADRGVPTANRRSSKIASNNSTQRVAPPVPPRPNLSQRPNLDRRNTPQLSRRDSDTFRAEHMLDVPSSPVNRERSQWQTMLASVLQGEVIRSEQRRISGTLTQKQQLDQRYQTWLGIRAYLRGRSVPEERQRIDERRVDAEAVLDEVLKFEVQKDSPKSPYDQVVDILTKVDKIESLYPSRNALILDKPLYAGSPFQHKMEALNSWLTISNSLRSQLKVLKNWAGSEDLLISRSQHPLSPDKRIETTFIERILKDGIKKTFEIQIMAFLRGLLAKSKAGMIENALVFKKMQLPTYINELQQLASFPSNLMEEILKVQVETHSQTATKHSGTVLDDLIESFGVSLQLAVRIKHECEDLDTRADGWSLANSLSPSYDVILLKSLKCYFTLLNWRLKSTTDTSFFKEAEMLENEWNFMSNLCFFIQGGDVETAVQFCQLEAELLRKVLNYLQKGMDGLGDPCVADGNFAMGGSGLVKWYARMWDNVKSRAGKLLQFQKMLVREFENAAEYTSDVPSPVLLRNFLHAGYSLVRTDAYANQGLYILASPSLHNRPECVSRLLRGCFARYEPFPSSIGKGYIIILPVSDRVRGSSGMNWQGRSMHVRIGKQIRPISLKSDRFRLVADTLEHLDVCKTLFEENINCKVKAVKLRRAHVQSVHDALKNTKGALVTLTEGIISSVKTVRDAINRVTAGGGSPAINGPLATERTSTSSLNVSNDANATAEGVHTAADLIEDMFTFASGFGLKALKYVGNRKKYDFMMKNLVKLSVDWVDFCAANCSLPAASVQHKTFKWNLRALYFAMNATSGTTIYLLADDEFEELKRGVGRCMRVLIKGFEQGGSISIAGVTATTPEEAVNALVANAARSASKLSSPHPPEAAPKSADSSKGSDMNLAGAAVNRSPMDLNRAEVSALKIENDGDSDRESNAGGEGSDGDKPKISITSPKSEAVTASKPPPQRKKTDENTNGGKASPKSQLQTPSSTTNPPSTASSASSSPLKGAIPTITKTPPMSHDLPLPAVPTKMPSGGHRGDTYMQRKQGAWMSAIEKLEEDREMRQLTNRMIGKVLDSSNIVDRNLSYLASTSSSISFRWQQGKFLGGGSFGSVYMAINLETADLMAVKEIRFTDVTSLETVQRAIKDEMNVLQLLHHPNIIEYYGVEVHRDKLYIFMEYCPQSIAQLIDHGGRFNDERATKVYAKQLLRGVEYLHNKGIVHRDIKPANTLLGQEGQIKYVDFGASKIYKTQKTVVVNGEANTLVGTPHYIAPEVITGESLGRHGAQDIWSMGCCVLEMVTGRKPWSGLDNEWAVMYHIGIANKMPPLPEPHELSEEGIDFLTKCFTRPASQRPSAKELLEHSWVKDVDDTDLTLVNAIMDEHKEAAENARARTASANGESAWTHRSGGHPSTQTRSSGGAPSTGGNRTSTGFSGFEAYEASQPVFIPARSPQSEHGPSWAARSGLDESSPGSSTSAGSGVTDSYFPSMAGNTTANTSPKAQSVTGSPSSIDDPQGAGHVGRVFGKEGLRDQSGMAGHGDKHEHPSAAHGAPAAPDTHTHTEPSRNPDVGPIVVSDTLTPHPT